MLVFYLEARGEKTRPGSPPLDAIVRIRPGSPLAQESRLLRTSCRTRFATLAETSFEFFKSPAELRFSKGFSLLRRCSTETLP